LMPEILPFLFPFVQRVVVTKSYSFCFLCFGNPPLLLSRQLLNLSPLTWTIAITSQLIYRPHFPLHTIPQSSAKVVFLKHRCDHSAPLCGTE
jgi:hypothetical protein